MLKGLLGIILFALDVWAIASVINSDATRSSKILWVILIAVLPFVGLLLWWFAGPKASFGPRR